MFTIIFVCPTDRLLTHYRQVANRSPTVSRQSANTLASNIMQTVGRLSADCWPTVGRLSAVCQPSVGRLLANSLPTVGQQSANCRPTVYFGNYSSLLSKALGINGLDIFGLTRLKMNYVQYSTGRLMFL